jgi:hypothetical protein
MMARRSNQRVLPPCASGLFLLAGLAPGAVCASGPAAGIRWGGPGRPRGPP